MFFRSTALVLACCAAIPGAALAQAAQAPTADRDPPTRATMVRNLDTRFAEIDTNKDGMLVAAEISAAQNKSLQNAAAMQEKRIEAEFAKLDTNKDKQLSLTEFKAAAPAIRPSGTAADMIGQLDTSKDGKISKAEYSAVPLSNFDRADTNKNGTLDAAEAEALRSR